MPNGLGSELNVIVDTDQPNALSGKIGLVDTLRLAKTPDAPSAAPPITRYTYLRKDQEWRVYMTNAIAPEQCDVDRSTESVFPLMAHRVNDDARITAPPRRLAWAGRMLCRNCDATRFFSDLCYYGRPIPEASRLYQSQRWMADECRDESGSRSGTAGRRLASLDIVIRVRCESGSVQENATLISRRIARASGDHNRDGEDGEACETRREITMDQA